MSCCSGTPLHHAPDCKLVHGDDAASLSRRLAAVGEVLAANGCDCDYDDKAGEIAAP